MGALLRVRNDSRWTRAAVAAALVLPVLVVGPGARAATSSDLRRELQRLTDRIETSRARQAQLTDAEVKLLRQVESAQQQADSLSERLRGRIRATYTAGLTTQPMLVMLSSDDPSAVLERVSLLRAAQRYDRAELARSKSVRRTLSLREARLRALRRDAASLDRRLAADAAVMRGLFDRVSAQERAATARAEAKAREAKASRLAAARKARAARVSRVSRVARVSRERASRSASVSGKFACMVGPTNAYSDTWGAPRSGGRRHKGTDVFAPQGSPAYAVTDGVIIRTGTGGAGGIVIYLRGDNGDEYYYAHNSANLARTGDRVAAGEQIARVGDTGNARGMSPHIHFEVHPGGGAPVNPYPFVRRACG